MDATVGLVTGVQANRRPGWVALRLAHRDQQPGGRGDDQHRAEHVQQHHGDGKTGEVLHEPDHGLGGLDREQAARGAADRPGWPAGRNHSAADSPISRNTRSAWNWLACCGSSPLRWAFASPAWGPQPVTAVPDEHGGRRRRTPSASAANGRPTQRRARRLVAGAETAAVATDHRQGQQEVERHDPGVQVGEHGDPAEDRLRRDASEAQHRQPEQVAAADAKTATKVATAMTTRTKVSMRLLNSIGGGRRAAVVNEASVQRGQVGQPRPEPVSRTAPPVTTSSPLATSVGPAPTRLTTGGRDRHAVAC